MSPPDTSLPSNQHVDCPQTHLPPITADNCPYCIAARNREALQRIANITARGSVVYQIAARALADSPAETAVAHTCDPYDSQTTCLACETDYLPRAKELIAGLQITTEELRRLRNANEITFDKQVNSITTCLIQLRELFAGSGQKTERPRSDGEAP